jgi:CheY-like chemotaxis protein
MTSMTAAAPAATILPSVTLQPNVSLQPNATLQPNAPLIDKALEKSLNEKPLTEKSVDKMLSDKAADKSAPSALAINLQASPVTPLSPSALSAAVAPTARSNLRVVPNISTSASPMSASLPAAARIADAPMQATPAAPVAPVAAAAAAPLAPPVTPVLPPDRPTARHEEHNFRVLAVDDSPLMRTFLQNKLQPYGINPEFAASGEEALFKISKQHYDLIFLDVMLPGMDGYDVCKMIKKNKDNNLMKVVMLTSKDKTFDKIRGTMAGCDGYLTKPVDELKLRAIIERHSVSQK